MAQIYASNFSSNSLSGTTTIRNGFANITLQSIPYALEGNKSFVVKLRRNSIYGEVVAASANITLNDFSSFVSLTANTATVAEGNLISFTLVTANTQDYSNVYLSIFPVTANLTNQDFYSNTAVFTIVNNTATAVLRANADMSVTDENGETFKVQLRTTSPDGNIYYTSSNIAILDTSYYVSYVSNSWNVATAEAGDPVAFTFNTKNEKVGRTYFYSTLGNALTTIFNEGNIGSFAITSDSTQLSLNIGSIADVTNFKLVIRENSQTGNIVATSSELIVNPVVFTQATGGDMTAANGYVIHSFTSSGNFTVTQVGSSTAKQRMNVVIVGGGGGSGVFAGGGGGGAIIGNIILSSTTTLPFVVGAAGAAGVVGTNSRFANVTAGGGGIGTPVSPYSANGGGGGQYYGNYPGIVGIGISLQPNTTQPGSPSFIDFSQFGCNGGTASNGPPLGFVSGAGGGAGTPANIYGGDGIFTNIRGVGEYFGGGGSGIGPSALGNHRGGLGGGGQGAGSNAPRTITNMGLSGNTNTGGGAGGDWTIAQAGGSGIAIIRYPFSGIRVFSFVPNVSIIYANIASQPNVIINFNMTKLGTNNQTVTYYTTGNVTSNMFVGGNTGSAVLVTDGSSNITYSNLSIVINGNNLSNTEVNAFQLVMSYNGSVVATSNTIYLSQLIPFGITTTGATIINNPGNVIYVYNASGSFNVTQLSNNPSLNDIDFAIIGGGSAPNYGSYPAGRNAGGGGAGGMVVGRMTLTAAGPSTVTIGAGAGAGSVAHGGNTTISFPAMSRTLIAYGGGKVTSMVGGGGGAAGSGGGPQIGFVGPYGDPAVASYRQGFNGSSYLSGSPGNSYGGGGGGAGQAGADGYPNPGVYPAAFSSPGNQTGMGNVISWSPAAYGTNGGSSNPISAPLASRWFAAGGQEGMSNPSEFPGSGGKLFGGGGQYAASPTGDGLVNTGSGGGLGGGGNGGSGIVMIRLNK
jgi:hypothetical protein